MCIGADGAFYSAVRSNVPISRRAGGPGGAETTITMTSANIKCWDGRRYIYGLSTTHIWTYDTQTNTLTSVAASPTPASPSSTLSRFCAIDGYIFHINAAGTPGEIYNAATGVKTGTFSVASPGTDLISMEVNKDWDGNYRAIHFNTSNMVSLVNFGPDLSEPNVIGVVSQVVTHTVPKSAAAPWISFAFKNPDAPGVIGAYKSGTIMIHDLVTGKLSKSYPVASLGTGALFPVIDASLLNADFGSVTARAIGIEVS
jgi:hypothetical protein